MAPIGTTRVSQKVVVMLSGGGTMPSRSHQTHVAMLANPMPMAATAMG